MWIKEKHILSLWPCFIQRPCVAEQSQMRLTQKICSSKTAQLNSIQAVIWNPRKSSFYLFDADSQKESCFCSHVHFSALYSRISRSLIYMEKALHWEINVLLSNKICDLFMAVSFIICKMVVCDNSWDHPCLPTCFILFTPEYSHLEEPFTKNICPLALAVSVCADSVFPLP